MKKGQIILLYLSSLVWDRVEKSESLGVEEGIIFQKTDRYYRFKILVYTRETRNYCQLANNIVSDKFKTKKALTSVVSGK